MARFWISVGVVIERGDFERCELIASLIPS
jgi:hypothetical protein